MISHLSNKAISEKTLNKNCVLRLFLILIINLISKVITDNIPDWNYKNRKKITFYILVHAIYWLHHGLNKKLIFLII